MKKFKVTPKIQAAHKAAVAVRKKSHSPYSKFKVGSALVTKSGEIIDGCNVENVSYGGTICAERVAILKAVSEGQKSFTDIVVVTEGEKLAPPCAFCLQVMAEFFTPKTKIWLASPTEIESVHTFEELLPYAFTPSFLLGK